MDHAARLRGPLKDVEGGALRRERASWGLVPILVMAVALVVWFGLFSRFELPLPPAFGNGDKAAHVLGFAVMASVAGLIWGASGRLCLVLLAAAAGLEFAQLLVPLRETSFVDGVASFAGILIGLAIARTAGGMIRKVAHASRRP